MRRIHRHSLCMLAVAMGILSLPAGCTSKHLTASVADQTFEPGQTNVAAAQAPTPVPKEETRMTETPVPPPSPQPMEQAAPTTAAPTVIELTDVYFDFDRATLRSDARSALEADSHTLKAELKHAKILIEGHCDERGTAAYNLVLGEKRALAVKRYLHDMGVASSQIQVASFGKERPFCTEHSLDCWQNNRRAHFAIK